MSYFQYTTLNRVALNNSSECACVYCLRKFDPSIIDEWCMDIDPTTQLSTPDTALCPKCGVDTIVPNSLIKYTDNDLVKWHHEGFK